MILLLNSSVHFVSQCQFPQHQFLQYVSRGGSYLFLSLATAQCLFVLSFDLLFVSSQFGGKHCNKMLLQVKLHFRMEKKGIASTGAWRGHVWHQGLPMSLWGGSKPWFLHWFSLSDKWCICRCGGRNSGEGIQVVWKCCFPGCVPADALWPFQNGPYLSLMPSGLLGLVFPIALSLYLP